jgi:hypothetical protein
MRDHVDAARHFDALADKEAQPAAAALFWRRLDLFSGSPLLMAAGSYGRCRNGRQRHRCGAMRSDGGPKAKPPSLPG